jgi:hypothetical protein
LGSEDLCNAQKILIAIPAGYERQADGHAVRSCESGHVNYWHVRSLDRAGQPMAILESLRLLTVHTELKQEQDCPYHLVPRVLHRSRLELSERNILWQTYRTQGAGLHSSQRLAVPLRGGI